MGSIVFSQTSARAPATVNWLAPVQAAFAFFASPHGGTHVCPNRLNEAPSPRLAASDPACASTAQKLTVNPTQIVLNPRLMQGLPAQRHGGSQLCGLKILREFEPGKSRSSTGRLVISGRMADVCAVLDRMATQSPTAP